jgi:hypothetical protein
MQGSEASLGMPEDYKTQLSQKFLGRGNADDYDPSLLDTSLMLLSDHELLVVSFMLSTIKSLGLIVVGRKWFAKYHDSAVGIPSPEFDSLCSIAAENEVLLSVGIIEKEGGTLYCTAVLIDRDGRLLYAHRKARTYAGLRQNSR